MPKFFPIKTETACALKWSWSTLYIAGGKSAACHRTGWDTLTIENFDNFHNTEKKLRERQDMLDGKWPVDSCAYCREIEEVGGFSDRKLHLTIPDQYPQELDTNPTAINIQPTILEVFFNNTCNLGCLYCIPSLSSKINQENKKFGTFNQDGVILEQATISNVPAMTEKFWQWMNINSQALKRFNILGGEPFYQDEFYKLLDYFEEVPHPNLELGIVTNLMISSNKLEQVCDKFIQLLTKRKLKRIDITASIDCWGQEQEYVRYGLNLELWEKNFNFLLDKKWLTVNINQTISVLTIKTMPELLKKLSEWNLKRKVGHYFSAITPQPSYLMIDIFGKEVFYKDFETIINLTTDPSASEYMQGLLKLIENSQPNRNEIQKLKTFLNEKDRRRNTDWKQIFPWLEEVFSRELNNKEVVNVVQ